VYIFRSSNFQVQVKFREYQYLCILGFLLKNVINLHNLLLFCVATPRATYEKVEDHTLRVTDLYLNIVSLDVILSTSGGKIIVIYSDNNYKHLNNSKP